MESTWVLNVGLICRMINISKIKHSSFLRRFLRILKFSPRFTRLTSCFSKKGLPTTECFSSPIQVDEVGGTRILHNLHHTTHIEIHIHWHSSCWMLYTFLHMELADRISMFNWTKKEREPRWKGWVAILVLEKMKIYFSGELLPWGKSRHIIM